MSDTGRPLSVSEAMGAAKRALEGIRLTVVGEVSDAKDSSGWKAVYFKLRDEGASMQCLMWRDVYAAAGVPLADGMLVEATGGFTAYPPKGQMQFQVRSLRAAGEGALRLRVAALARRLEAEGLMREERKRPLPEFPSMIGVVTSPRGAAVHDILRTTARRFPAAAIVVAGVAVEGASAAAGIVEGLRAVASHPGVEVVIVARGGGSYEDLMPFNDEELARAIVACPVPVVTGIGHEPDTSIADMVADVRASTPTAAAEAVTPSTAQVSARFDGLARLLGSGLAHAARRAESRVAVLGASPALRDPRGLLAIPSQRLDRAAAALSRELPRVLARARERLTAREAGLAAAGPRLVERAGERCGHLAARLSDLSPVGIMGRGYAVCYDAEGRHLVRAASDLTAGDRMRVRMHDGAARCLVEGVELEAAE